MLLVLTTISDRGEAEALASQIVDAKLAACVQILPPMTSIYVWEGKVQKEFEHLLLIKTLSARYDALEAFIKANHSYAVPEIVAIESVKVSKSYLNWLSEILH